MDLNLSVDVSRNSKNSYCCTSKVGPLIFTNFFLLSVLTSSTNSPSTRIFYLLAIYEISSPSIFMASEKVLLPVTYELLAMGVTTSVDFITTNEFSCETPAFFIGDG